MKTILFKKLMLPLLFMAVCIGSANAATGSMTVGGQTGISLTANNSGTGWTWTAATATLTLTNTYSASPIGINCGVSETVNLVYSSSVSVTSNSSSAISCDGNLNISGSGGTLTVTSSSSSNLYCAIEVLGALGISNGIINATCAGSGTDPSAAVIYGSGGVTVSGSSNVTATATGNDASSIYVEQGNITISTSGTVAANGKGAGSAINLRNGHTLDMSSGSLALTGNPLDGNRYSALNITGGNITIGGTSVYKAILTLSGVTTEAEVTSVSSPAVGYGISSKKTSSDGKLCFLLPQGSQTVTLVAGGKTYTGTVNVATNHTTTGTLAVQSGSTYTISASALTSFGSLETPYTQPAAQTVTITNTGTGNVTLTQPAATNYVIGTLSTATLASNGSTATFTVRPKAGLAAGTYNETITVSGTGGASATVSANFAVTAPTFVAVTGITGVPTAMTAGTPITLTGTVTPATATNKTITWSVQSAGTTGATISGGSTLNTTAAGTAIIRATIVNGASLTTNYTQDFTVTVKAAPPVPVFDGLADEYTAGSPAVQLKAIGTGSEGLTVFKVNGTAATELNPATAGTYLVEAASADGKLRIWKYVKVK